MATWMVRAGTGSYLFEDFKKNSVVAIGWKSLGDISRFSSRDELQSQYIEFYGNEKPTRTGGAVAMLHKFVHELKKGDILVTYDRESRVYLITEDKGEFEYRDELIVDYPQIRSVKILGEVKRDELSQEARNSLGSVLTLFSISEEVRNELLSILEGGSSSIIDDKIIEDDEQYKDTTIERSTELIKDKINQLDPAELEELTASVLRAMGFKARVSPKGADRNVDVFASPDGLGLTTPRIKAEVKHRKDAIGAPLIRSFIGALREGDRGLFVSTGGFTKEAKYEAERANIPIQLINLDDLAHLVIDHYEQFNIEGQRLVPLVKIYWPA